MKKLHKLAMVTLLSTCAAIHATQAKADERDGTIERYVCLQSGVEPGHINAEYVNLNANEVAQKFGFGGGNMALKLSNDGQSRGFYQNYAGGAATFVLAKKQSQFKIYFKPVGVNQDHCRVLVCIRKADGEIRNLAGQLSGYKATSLSNGWYSVGGDLNNYNGEFTGATINRISLTLDSAGDNGYILMGNTQVLSKKELLDPSKLVMDAASCTNTLVCAPF
ncbi:MAG: hypothetical protein JST44_20205 [Cyanobacteria bacterium SZAS LIN-5]|nr:hypothetical protein [Cyanobacteria bacterium SZAS LIN-5]